MTRLGGGLCGAVVCLWAVPGHGAELQRLVLDPPQFWLDAAAPGDAGTSSELSDRQVDWLVFGTDALLEAGISASETGLLFFGAGLLALDNAGGAISILGVGLLVLLHPLLDALLVDDVAGVSHRFEPSYLVTLGGAYLGCLLGAAGFGLAVVLLQAWPVVEILVASVLNALLPAAGAALAEIWSKQPAEPRSPVARAAGAEPDWTPTQASPVARLAF
ncbi:MAG TPA: hypothetical protein VMB50_23375 [Myxococcales bacterium]|nr:hypothetical protein [Myxococcales bacterium]